MVTNNNRETSKIQYRMVIPRVLDKNRSLFLNLSPHGLQIASDIWLIIKENLKAHHIENIYFEQIKKDDYVLYC